MVCLHDKRHLVWLFGYWIKNNCSTPELEELIDLWCLSDLAKNKDSLSGVVVSWLSSRINYKIFVMKKTVGLRQFFFYIFTRNILISVGSTWQREKKRSASLLSPNRRRTCAKCWRKWDGVEKCRKKCRGRIFYGINFIV